MQRIACMQCLICASLEDVWGTVSRANLTSLEPALSDHSEQILLGCQRWRATAKSRKLNAASEVIARTSRAAESASVAKRRFQFRLDQRLRDANMTLFPSKSRGTHIGSPSPCSGNHYVSMGLFRCSLLGRNPYFNAVT